MEARSAGIAQLRHWRDFLSVVLADRVAGGVFG
jgi:hypothetical protein